MKENDDKNDINKVIGYFRNLTRVYGVSILSNPSEIVISDTKFATWQHTLEDNFKKFGKLQAILVFLKEEEEPMYHQLKELLTLKLQCVSQVIKNTTLFGPNCKKPYAIATDIMLQIITKIGAAPWSVIKSKTALTSSSVMQGALLLDQHPDQSSFWFAGFTNNDATQLHSSFKLSIKKKEGLKSALESVLLAWAKKFFQN